MKKINNKTFYKYSFLSNLTANDCGDKAIFVRQTPNEEKDTYDSNLYIYKNKEVSKLTSCNSAGQAFWYDDKTVAFTSKRDESEKPKNKDKTDSKKEQKKIKLYKKDTTSSAESEFFLELEGEISNIKRLANGKLVYLKKRDIREADSEYFSGQEDEEGYMRIRRIPFYSNGTTFTFNKITALCVYDIEAEKEEEITCEDYSILSYDLSLAKDKILIIASKLQKKYLSYTALFEFDVKANELKKVLDDDTYSSKDPYGIYAATYLENKVLFLGSTMKKHGLNENKIAYTIEKDGEIKTLNSKDVNYLNSGIQDMELASGDQYRAFDSHVDFITTIGIINKISRLHSDGKFEEDIFLAKGGMSCFDYVDDKILYIGLEANSGQEIYLEGKKISNFHSFLDDYYVAIPEIQNFKSTDFNIDGFVLLPEDYNEKDEFPAVLEIHGGPKAAYQPTYFHEMQMLASEGYVVMYCNPRGSAGKGNVFQDIFGMYGTNAHNGFVRTVFCKHFFCCRTNKRAFFMPKHTSCNKQHYVVITAQKINNRQGICNYS